MDIDDLKDELKAQKLAIESKNGVVTVSGTNPSPSEITAGIGTIQMPNMESATATVDDVVFGKTFYSGDLSIKTGNLVPLDNNCISMVYLYTDGLSINTASNRYSYVLPNDITHIRPYAFYGNLNYVDFYFNENVEYINTYAFNNAKNFEFKNFGDMINLYQVAAYGFRDTGNGINLSEIPESLKSFGNYSFYNCARDGDSLTIPLGVIDMGSYVFSSYQGRKALTTFTIPPSYTKGLASYMLYNLSFNCDLTTPTGCTAVSQAFNRCGSFNNVTLKTNISKVDNYAFGGMDTDPVSNYHMSSITFERVSPPTIGVNPIFATQHMTNNFKIYVPDQSVSAYKAVANLSRYVDYIHPVSEKD